jgi:hypothetical protein
VRDLPLSTWIYTVLSLFDSSYLILKDNLLQSFMMVCCKRPSLLLAELGVGGVEGLFERPKIRLWTLRVVSWLPISISWMRELMSLRSLSLWHLRN